MPMRHLEWRSSVPSFGVPEDDASPRRSRRRTVLWVVSGVVVLFLLWVAASAWQLVRAYEDSRRGLDAVNVARSQLSGSDLVNQLPLAPLSAAHADFASAEAHLSWPLLAPLHVVPVAGRQYSSAQHLASAAEQVTSAGSSAVSQVHEVLGLPHSAGPDRVATLRRLAAVASSTHASLTGLDLGPSQALLSPLASKRAQFVGELDKVDATLQHASTAATSVADLLSTPHTYLLLAANNAEIRAGSGTFLQVGLLTTGDGHVQVSKLTPTGALALPGTGVPIGGDLAANWGWLKPNLEWRNLGLTPQFDVTGPLAAAMWRSISGQHVDGVMAVDVETLHQMLGATGPVSVDGQEVGADNVVQLLMHDQYEGVTYDSAARQGRQDRLGDLANATFSALDSQKIDLSTLASAMTRSAEGRHILVWAPDPATQAAWEAAGVAGRLADDNVMAAVINRGGNKLDQYLAVTTKLSLRQTGGSGSGGSAQQGPSTEATLTVHLQNNTPPGQSPYIAGPDPGSGNAPGEYVGLVAVNLPAYARDPSVAGHTTLAAAGAEGPTMVLAVPVSVLAGQGSDVVVHFRLPGEHGEMKVVPTARIPAVDWDGARGSFNDSSPHSVSW